MTFNQIMNAIRNGQNARHAKTGQVVYFEEANYRNFDTKTSRVTCYLQDSGACMIVSIWDLEALYGASPLATVLGWVAEAGLKPAGAAGPEGAQVAAGYARPFTPFGTF